MLPKATVLCPNQMKNIWTTRLLPKVEMPKGRLCVWPKQSQRTFPFQRQRMLHKSLSLCDLMRWRYAAVSGPEGAVSNETLHGTKYHIFWLQSWQKKMISALNQVLQFAVFVWIMGRGVRKYNQTASHLKEKNIMETGGIIRATADMAPIFNSFPFHGNQ